MTRATRVVWAFLFLFCTAASAATTPGGMVFLLEPVLVNPAVGDTFAVQVRGKDFPDAIDGGGLNITFDSALLQLLDVTAAPQWADFFSPGALSNARGTVENLYFNSLDMDGVSGEFDIVKLTFAAISSGIAQIQLAGDDVFIFGRLGEQFMPRFVGRGVAISAIPEPDTWLTAVVGILLIIGIRTFGLGSFLRCMAAGNRLPRAKPGSPALPGRQ